MGSNYLSVLQMKIDVFPLKCEGCTCFEYWEPIRSWVPKIYVVTWNLTESLRFAQRCYYTSNAFLTWWLEHLTQNRNNLKFNPLCLYIVDIYSVVTCFPPKVNRNWHHIVIVTFFTLSCTIFIYQRKGLFYALKERFGWVIKIFVGLTLEYCYYTQKTVFGTRSKKKCLRIEESFADSKNFSLM